MIRSYFFLLGTFFSFATLSAQGIPLAEHPRPDFERAHWQNLNGNWSFAFDPLDEGLAGNWATGKEAFPLTISVPFPWGAPLSGLKDEADIGWYQREITVPADWQTQRTFLTIGASDWETHVWLDGHLLGSHQGGYTPFSVELTEHLRYGQAQKLVIRVDDARRDFTLYGKQGYGNARGIWQTVYLEARGPQFIDALHMLPNIDAGQVEVTVYLPEETKTAIPFVFQIPGLAGATPYQTEIPAGKLKHRFTYPVPNPHLWTLDDPFLYEVTALLGTDEVKSYFGMRKISVVNLPGTEYPYIALNNEPIYLQLALDQSYHAEGFYTFPSDQFMREEIERSKEIGLNGIRTHIKIDIPRKLYWADKLGLLVMSDLPNSWGEPDERMREESTYTLKEMIKRDFNHPSIFSWVVFNETWGLVTEVVEEGKKRRAYLPETQQWVASMYYLTKSLDPSRIVEDNSICCGRGHTVTDLNSWHAYLPGWEWDNYLAELTENTYVGSEHHFEAGFKQGNQPNINSECGNVWGYEGSTGDVDWSYDYHRMMNSFRRYPKVAGWLYTEHHDVINEWNGYWRFDRTEKETGMGEMVPGMSLRDLHSAVYLSMGNEICQTVQGGTEVSVPLFLSAMTGEELGPLQLVYELETTNYIGETEKNLSGSRQVDYQPWVQTRLEPLLIPVPNVAGLAILRIRVEDAQGKVLHRNFMHFEIQSAQLLSRVTVLSRRPDELQEKTMTDKAWAVREGRKMNGLKSGAFTYAFDLTAEPTLSRAKSAYFLIELSAKEFFVKDQQAFNRDQDYMKGSVVAPSSNPNSYPMTDETKHPSTVVVSFNGKKVQQVSLPDDPADHRGVLSWHHQLQDRKLQEAGSYGYLVKVPLTRAQLKEAAKSGTLSVRLEIQGEGGMAVYGKAFGRYPFDPSLVVKY